MLPAVDAEAAQDSARYSTSEWKPQARWPDDSPFMMLPGVEAEAAGRLAAAADGGNGTLPALLKALRQRPADAQKAVRQALGNQVQRCTKCNTLQP